MIDMRMGKQHGAYVTSWKGQLAVDFPGLLTPALISAAVEEKPAPFDCYLVHGAGHRLCGSMKRELHQLQDGTGSPAISLNAGHARLHARQIAASRSGDNFTDHAPTGIGEL